MLFKHKDELISARLAYKTDASEGDPDELSLDLNWSTPEIYRPSERDEHEQSGWTITRRRANIEDYEFVLPADGRCSSFDLSLTPALIKATLDRASKEREFDSENALVITPYSILYREIKGSANRQVEVKLATWRAKAKDVRGLAFRRSGQSLVIQRTPHPEGDWIWRAGIAVADVLGAVADVSDRPADEEAENADLTRDPIRTQAALRRKLLSRIQGAFLPPTVHSADLDSGILPRHIQRALDALTAAANEQNDRGRAIVLLHFLEGRAMVLRGRLSPALESVPSGPAGVLARLGQVCLRERDEAFHERDVAFGQAFGRATDAYRRIAVMIEAMARHTIPTDIAVGLQVAASGARLWAMTIAWREFALALLARLDGSMRQSLLDMRPALGAWELGGSAYLIDPRFGVKDADSDDFSAPVQAEELCLTIVKALTADREIDARIALDRVTLLGWVIVAGMATGTIPMVPPKDREERSPLPQPPSPQARETVAGILPALVTILSSGRPDSVDDGDLDWPWELFRDLTSRGADREAESTLVKAAAAVGIGWHQPGPKSKALTDLEGRDSRFSYAPPDSAYRPGYWRLSYTTLPGELKPRLETVVNDQAMEFQVWTTIQDTATGEPLVISVASNALSVSSGLSRPVAPNRDGLAAPLAGSTHNPNATEIPADPEQEVEEDGGVTSPGAATPSTGSESDAASITDACASAPPSGGGPPPNDPGTYQSDGDSPDQPDRRNKDPLKEWRIVQKSAWKDRSFNPENPMDRGYFRFAFLQTDFADGYEDPTPPACQLEIIESDGTIEPFGPKELCWPDALTISDHQPCSDDSLGAKSQGRLKLCLDEWRRRKVLIDVLDVCQSFNVNVLLLPEYSTRAETVLWLAKYIEKNGMKLSVWAGTFRVPSKFDVLVNRKGMTGTFFAQGLDAGSGNDVWRSLDAVLPVIFRESVGHGSGGFHSIAHNTSTDSESYLLNSRISNQIIFRKKIYPALAYEEVFRPTDVTHQLWPIMIHSRNPVRAESYISELICSEIFALNGPTNVRVIAENLFRLHKQVNSQQNDGISLKDFESQIFNNYNSFSRFIAQRAEGKDLPRRTVVMLPCITTRAKDYHAFGTTLRLSAGSNIIFCNSSLSGFGGGESCVIGFRSWDERPNKSKLGPYHGVLPGLYIPSDGNGIKPLGPRERALVVVDIDPLNPALPNPRPQYVSEPVRLVAHLPVIEAKSAEVPGWDVRTSNTQKIAELADSAKQIAVINTVPPTYSMPNLNETINSTLAIAKPSNEAAMKITISALKDIYRLYSESPSLKLRAETFEKYHGGIPESWPPPVLTDWIAVDLDIQGFVKCIKKLKTSKDITGLDGITVGPGMPLIWLDPKENGL